MAVKQNKTNEGGGQYTSPETHRQLKIKGTFLEMLRIIDENDDFVILAHDDTDGLFAGVGMEHLLEQRKVSAKVDRRHMNRPNLDELDIQAGKTYILVDLAPDQADMPEDDPGLLSKRFSEAGAKLILIDHHKDFVAHSSHDTAILDVAEIGGNPMTATGIVDELNYYSGSPGFHERRLTADLTQTTDGLAKGPVIDAIAAHYGANVTEFNQLTFALTLLAGSIDRLIEHPEVWPGGKVPEVYTSGDFREIPHLMYAGMLDVNDVKGTGLYPIPSPIKYEELSEALIKASGDSECIVAVLDEFYGPQSAGTLASVLEEHGEKDFVGVFQRLPDGSYSFTVRTDNPEYLEGLTAENESDAKVIHVGRNIYVSTRRTQPLTEDDVTDFLGRVDENHNTFVARTGGVNKEVLAPHLNQNVAEILR
ncbi:MAG: hypothetical protein ABH851_04935 [Methanobacteriota archaeon]